MKRLTGLTPQAYIAEMRLTQARRLLQEGTLTGIVQLATTGGFWDARNFPRVSKSASDDCSRSGEPAFLPSGDWIGLHFMDEYKEAGSLTFAQKVIFFHIFIRADKTKRNCRAFFFKKYYYEKNLKKYLT